MSLLNKIFSEKKKTQETIQSPVYTDVHSHLIPGIDDGTQSMAESVELIRSFIKLGYKRLITTPHIMKDIYPNNSEIILSGLEKIKQKCLEEGIDITLEAGSEYYIDENFFDILKNKDILSFGDKYILIELNTINHSQIIYDAVFELRLNGYKPILAHPERYRYLWDDFHLYGKIKDMGVLFQLNVISLSGFYSPQVKKMAEKLIDHNLIDLYGSDAHDKRYLNFLKIALKTSYFEKLMKNPIINDKL